MTTINSLAPRYFAIAFTDSLLGIYLLLLLRFQQIATQPLTQLSK